MGPLVQDLAERLKTPDASARPPFILEDRIAQTRVRHAVVIWDAWADVDRAQRSNIILSAYARAGVLNHDSISAALGLTAQEAMELGFLPYSIITLRRRSDPVSLSDLKSAMEQIGGARLRNRGGLEVRFPTFELAQEAYRRLLEILPGPYWGIQSEKIVSESC